MRWALDPEQEMFLESFSDWLDRVAKPDAVRGMLDAAAPEPFERSLAEEGWLAVGTPESHGGQGGGLVELAIAAEQLARRAAPSSAWLATVLALPALDVDTAEEVANGRFAAVLASADAPIAPAGFSVKNDALSGSVTTVLGGDRADLFVVPAGDALYLVDAKADGVTVTPRHLLDRSRTCADVSLVNASGTRLSTESEPFLARAALRAAVLVAADSLGAAGKMLELAVEYSKQRTQFGSPIGSFQAMKHAAATMLVAEEASRSIVFYAAASVDAGLDDADLHAATAKAQATPAGSNAAESALTMHGAIGYTWEHDLQLLYKRAKLDVALFGDPAVWNERIAAKLDLIPVR
jgi:alkylation response protein AidB-like acyl-CoA dehydrogenase